MLHPPAHLVPDSVHEATRLLREYAGEARPLAGGTALTIMLRQRLIAPPALIDLTSLPGLSAIDIGQREVRIGALVTHREVERHRGIQRSLPVLARAFEVVANVRVRNQATVGGVVAEADYASDPPAVLVALGASVEVAGPDGERIVPVSDFFVGFYETALEPDEIVTAMRIPLPPPGAGSRYEKFVTRSSEDRPCIGVAAIVELEADGRTCQRAAVAVGAVAETPQHFPDVDAGASGKELDAALARRIAEAYAERIDPLDDMRGSSWYRTQMVGVWVRRALEAAGEDARTRNRNDARTVLPA